MLQVILATGNAAAIADANPESIVLDYQTRRRISGAGTFYGNTPAGRIFYRSHAIRLPAGQFRVGACIIAARGRTVAKAEIMEALFGDDEDGGPMDKMIDVRLCQVRKTLPALGIQIETVWGQGYRVINVAVSAQIELRRAA